jgi:hypothetical protein
MPITRLGRCGAAYDRSKWPFQTAPQVSKTHDVQCCLHKRRVQTSVAHPWFREKSCNKHITIFRYGKHFQISTKTSRDFCRATDDTGIISVHYRLSPFILLWSAALHSHLVPLCPWMFSIVTEPPASPMVTERRPAIELFWKVNRGNPQGTKTHNGGFSTNNMSTNTEVNTWCTPNSHYIKFRGRILLHTITRSSSFRRNYI